MADLKARQYKRIARIAENDPERAERVALRLKSKGPDRIDRGRQILADAQTPVKEFRPDTPLAPTPTPRGF